MTGARPRIAAPDRGWRVSTEHATVALACAVLVGLGAGVVAGLHGRGQVAVQVAASQAVAGGAETVPAPAVVIDPAINRTVVFVVVRGHALRQPVTVTQPAAGSRIVTVTSGLSPNSEVVVGPPPTLHDGSSVTTSPYPGR